MKLHKVAAALALGLCVLSAPGYTESAEDQAIRPFKAQVPQAALDDLLESDKRAAAQEENVRRVDGEELLMRMFASALRRNIGHRAFQNLQ